MQQMKLYVIQIICLYFRIQKVYRKLNHFLKTKLQGYFHQHNKSLYTKRIKKFPETKVRGASAHDTLCRQEVMTRVHCYANCYTNLLGVMPRWRNRGGGRRRGVISQPLRDHYSGRMSHVGVPDWRGPYHVVRVMHAGICLRMMTVAWQHWGICGSRKSIAGGPGVGRVMSRTI